ncbi:putative Cysteine-rich secretory protein 1 [Hypsibius exemplaris]|uniref:Cysteine-rich secretory protein 1 n=1 Tax=Hypsibius exemplaris TaxID=2072580 RepID=A0A1W0WNP0_HYPEX|nr:putative Cysteine-rich secretory protein 1 [Hypsibius exemplaris]
MALHQAKLSLIILALFAPHLSQAKPSSEQLQDARNTQHPEVQEFLTKQLNDFRRTVEATDMLEMGWDNESQELAQKLTDRCDFRLPKGAAEEAQYLQTSKHKCGLNMARSTGRIGWNETMHLWFKGGKTFRFGVDPKVPVGHYTAMVWAKSYLFGCGYTHCTTPSRHGASWPVYDFFACTFCPAGNITPERLFRPYVPGERCSKCPSACKDGLCTNSCPESNIYANCDELFPTGCGENVSEDMQSTLQPFEKQCKATCLCQGKDEVRSEQRWATPVKTNSNSTPTPSTTPTPLFSPKNPLQLHSTSTPTPLHLHSNSFHNSTLTPLQRHSNSTSTPTPLQLLPQLHSNSTPTPLQRHSNSTSTPTPLQLHSNATPTPFQLHSNSNSTPTLLHRFGNGFTVHLEGAGHAGKLKIQPQD